jgi:hypothetical protein
MRGTKQIPAVSRDVQKHRNLPVWFRSTWSDEFDASRDQPLVVSIKIVYAQEEADTAAVLVPYELGLTVTVCACQQQARFGARRSHDHPALGSTIGGLCACIFHQLELQDVNEESDRWIVLMHQNRYELQMGHCDNISFKVWVWTDSTRGDA